jgi:predicted nucleic acid-binding protein
VNEGVLCLDTGVIVKFLVPEEPEEFRQAATRLVHRAVTSGRLVAPAFAWAEVGSVLQKKLRQRLLESAHVDLLWRHFSDLPIDFVEMPVMRTRAWNLARSYGLPTLYDAAFLACAEVVASHGPMVEFWTADQVLLRQLGPARPPYVRELGQAQQ